MQNTIVDGWFSKRIGILSARLDAGGRLRRPSPAAFAAAAICSLALSALPLSAKADLDVEAIKPDGFARGVALTVAGYDANRSALANFPVLVRISETGISGFDYDDLMFTSTGDDICFVADDGTPLAFEIDTWDTTGESLVWVNLPTMTNGTEFAMFYRSSKKGKVDVCTANPFSNYVGVWHLREGGDGPQSVYDSTGNALTALSSDKSLAVPAGMVGAARTVTTKREKADKGIKVQTTKGTELAALDTLGADFVVSFWMRPLGVISTGDAGVRYDCLIGRKSQKTEKAWHLQLADHSTNMRVWAAENTDSGNSGPKTTGDILPLVQNQWTKMDVVYSYTNSANVAKYTIYTNGAPLVTAANLTAKALGGSSTLTIGGGFNGGERPFWGDMDEVRVGPFIPSADWVKADYDQVATTTFLTAGTVAEFAEAANPVATLQLEDSGAAFAEFTGSISVCGGNATACSVYARVYPTGGTASEWTLLASGLEAGDSFSGAIVDLIPQTPYTYEIKAENNLDTPLDSEVATGTFTTSGAGEVGTGGAAKRVGDSMVHTFTIARNGTGTYEFVPPSYATSVEALVVGGGGAGGYRRGGGGGAGGLVYNAALGVTGSATYTVTVGAGGDASATADVYGGNGGDSSITGPGVSVSATGGGAGGNGELANLLDGRPGGSGGGSAHDGAVGAGTSGQGNDGGLGFNKSNKEFFGGGGGGAMEAGASVTSGNTTSSGKGGDGREYAISGVATFYAGGGGGGGTRSNNGNSYGSPGDGGFGGGGRGGQRMQDGAVDGDGFAYESARNGVDGLGGGGGGGGDTTGFYQGGDGGNGVVIIRYNVEGNGQGMTTPAVALESLSRDDQTGVTTIGYRVAWAGDGYDYADVKVAWGFSKDDLPNTNAIASSVIGRGTGTFTLPDQTKTVYVRAVAVNAGGYADQSPGFVTIPFVDPAAPEVEHPVVSNISSTGASFSAAVVGLGEGATSVQGVFQVCTEDDFEGTILSFPAAQTLTAAPGTFTATATGLAVNTLYYVRVSATNDVPDFFETEPVPFRTGVPGAPNGSVVTDLTQVANPPAECAPPVADTTTITAWGYLFTPGNNGASYADLRLEASTSAEFQEVAAYTATESAVTQRGYRSFTLENLEPETDYYLRLRMENDGRVVAYSAIVGPYTTAAESVNLTIPAVPETLVLVSVTTNGVAIAGAEGVYTVENGTTVVVTFVAAEGYELVGSGVVSVTVNGDTTLTGFPETVSTTPVSLSFPDLPENVSVASVTTNGVEVTAVEGVYMVMDGSSVVVTFAAADGYVLSGAPVSATITVAGATTFPAASIPTSITPAQAIKINEIMASNPSVDKGGIASEKGIAEMDWIELCNFSSQAIDITGWHLSDNAKPGKEDKATILGSCVVPANGYKIVWLDKIHVDPSEYAADEAFAVLKLSSSGEFLQLADPSKAVIQQIDFSTKKQIKGYSYGPLSVSSGEGLVPGNGPCVYMKTATPGAANVTEGFGDFTPAVAFSEPHGYKTAAFDLELSCPDDPTAQIYYTLDGKSPTTDSTPYTGTIHVDRTTVVRAAVPVENSILQFDTSATYIFLDDVLAQARTNVAPASAVGFPNDNAVNNQEMLYGMEQSIVNGADRDRLLRGFTNSIATLSVVVDPSNLFNKTTGIYVNPRGEGETWERQIMLEGFDPTGVGADFAQPAGIRLRGGNSRNTGKPKHSLRFFFRSSYGESSLAQKMFVGEPLSPNGEGKMKEEIGDYDKLDLRTSQNLSWANENSGNDTFVTEVFSRDSQRDLGQPYTRSRYYNLFINGQYWGLYQTQERGDEHWGESYLGGDSLQYDLIKTASTYVNNKLSYSIECNEGTWDAWSNLWHIATQEGFGEGHEANYNKVLGLNPDGSRNPAYPVLLNAKSLMVYMLVSHYVVDQDGPTSPFSNIDKGHANNFYAIRNRDDAGTVSGFVFLRHDAEMSMGQNGNTGASKNPTFWGTEEQADPQVPEGGSTDPSGLGKMKFRTIPYFTPAELHYLLMQNPTYKRQYADLFYRECLREGGAMTVEKATERYTSRMAEIDDAIVCEAARWGKSKTRSTWLNACKTSTTFITNRLANMKSQYQTAGWYPTVAAPFVVNATGDRYFDGGEVPYQEKVYLHNNDAQDDGTLYYTIDGTDPADSGIEYTAPFTIPDSGAMVRARLFKDDEWSALEEVALEMDIPNDQRYGIRIAAILNAAVNDPADEFIVLTNKLDRAVSLKGLSIWSEKTGQELVKLTEITSETVLPAGGSIKLTRNEYWPDPTETLKLKNGAINVDLRDYNGKRIQHTMVDSGSWFWTGEYDEKNKKIYACNKTGRWFVALEFLGDAEEGGAAGGEVTLESQWTPSPEAPAIPLPEDATARDEVLSVITNNAAIEDWYVGISTNSADGYVSITNFTGDAAAVELCYLLNNDVLDANMTTNNAVELKIPSISFDPTTGNVLIDGELLIHNSEVTRTVNGSVRLYYADSLDSLEASTDYLQITPPAFPVEHKDAGTTQNIPARFYRLKIE